MLLGESTGFSKLTFSLKVTGKVGWKEGIREHSMCSVVYPLTEYWLAGQPISDLEILIVCDPVKVFNPILSSCGHKHHSFPCVENFFLWFVSNLLSAYSDWDCFLPMVLYRNTLTQMCGAVLLQTPPVHDLIAVTAGFGTTRGGVSLWACLIIVMF